MYRNNRIRKPFIKRSSHLNILPKKFIISLVGEKLVKKFPPIFHLLKAWKKRIHFHFHPQMYFSWIRKWVKLFKMVLIYLIAIIIQNKINKNCFWIWFKFLIIKSLTLHYIFTLKMWYTASFREGFKKKEFSRFGLTHPPPCNNVLLF